VTRPVVVIGAGAAGLMAAIFAARAGAPVILLERTRDGGRKIMISGGGRCNVLPSSLSPRQYFTDSSPNSLRRMLLAWPLPEQQHFFEYDLGITLVLEQESGKLFPASNRARDVRDGLVTAALKAGVDIRYNTTVQDILEPHAGETWRVLAANAPPVDAAAVVVATGGLSVPATGSDGTGLRVLQRLGHTVHETYPALTPLTGQRPEHAALAGVSLVVRIEAPLPKGSLVSAGGFLFTHRGYSGPAVLDVSHLAVRAAARGRTQPLLVQWGVLDAGAWDSALRAGGTAHVGTVVRRTLPARLADMLLHEAGVEPQTPLAALRRDDRARLVTLLARYPLPWAGDEGYRKAEVTGGGIALSEVNPQTLESRRHRRLFLCGEVLDAFGPIGGYNFAWAWATGRSAGLGAAAAAGRGPAAQQAAPAQQAAREEQAAWEEQAAPGDQAAPGE
jgi:predicted Rossmann fold flavoprotein